MEILGIPGTVSVDYSHIFNCMPPHLTRIKPPAASLVFHDTIPMQYRPTVMFRDEKGVIYILESSDPSAILVGKYQQPSNETITGIASKDEIVQIFRALGVCINPVPRPPEPQSST